ncbi:MAG TPA: hypothetical protein VMT52_16315 [Planctomycetota bacterium]|nr:hypothetical protein [Planctomycetota bacterium]
MSPPSTALRPSLKALEALQRIRDLADQRARGRLLQKRLEISRAKEEIDGLKRRREAVLSRGGAGVLRERRLLDALMTTALSAVRKLEALNLQVAILLEEYRKARSQKRAVSSLRDRRRKEEALIAARREDSSQSDASASRVRGPEARPDERPEEDTWGG